jgi:hypothetical protein
VSSDTPYLDALQVATERPRQACPKAGLPTPIAKKEKQKTKDQQAKAFRDEVWKLDKGRSRATGKPLVKSGTDWDRLGEVDHSIPRSLAPDRIYDVSNGLLLSKTENRLRKVVCLHAPEFKMFDYTGPDNRREKQTFVWRDKDGTVTKTRIG